MNRSLSRFAPVAASALSLVLPLVAVAAEAPYRDAAQLRAEVVKVVTCEAKREEFMRMGSALTPLYYDKPEEVQPALAGWRNAKDANTFVAIFEMPEPIEVYGHSTRQVMMAGESLFAVLDGDLADALSKRFDLKASAEPLARHIRTRELRREALGDGIDATVTQTVSTLTTHPGKTMVGCEYKMAW